MRCPCRAIAPFVPVLQTGTLLKIPDLGLRPGLSMARALSAQDLLLYLSLLTSSVPLKGYRRQWGQSQVQGV